MNKLKKIRHIFGTTHAKSQGMANRAMRRMFAVALAACCLMLALAGCLNVTPAKSNPQSVESETEPVNVTLVLDWVINTNHTGIYVAQELGYFEQANIDLEIIQAPDMNFIEMVGVNSAQFGICGQEQLIQARATGGIPIKAIGTILQHNTSGFASPVSRNILTPKDFEGKIYSGWGTPLEESFIKTLMEKAGGDFSKVEMKMMGATDFFASMETEADFAWIYYGWDGIGAASRDYPINFMLLQDIDPALDFYSPLIITNEETLNGNPELVKSFMVAVSKGYEFAAMNPVEACEMLLESTPETDNEMALSSIEYLAEYFVDDNGEFGLMKDSVWQNFSSWMYEKGLVEEPVAYEDYYTNSFLS